ncbi:carbohydrate kinase family protein [Flavihumibacter profundi]|uniref:carbohydrate kinase family protein n=1 Tax=Flavihumibacter profundi TaxID=2716883 RepID=UPI001CC4ED0D|nr:PfkB family carbohydrate kinase [Flavihumibacter profundi]MBZ5858132.1 PfkB family carbohydrate kinase [Flavihumibacter profundi]
MQPPFVLAIGEALIDAVSTEFVTDLSEARQADLKPGGSPANLCRFLNQLGTPATLVAAVGKDALARIIINDLKAKGIDSSNIMQVPDQPTTLILVGKSKGTPDFIPYRGADQYIGKVGETLIHDCAIIHTTAFALSKEPAQTSILTAMHKGKNLGKVISVDWNYAEKIWGTSNNAKQVFEELVKLSPLLKFSLDDAERFFGRPMDSDTAKEILGKYNTTISCLTCGGDGAWYRQGTGNWKHVAAKPVEVKDSTGAGDSFWAGFMHAFLEKQSTEACIENALATAARRLEGKLH